MGTRTPVLPPAGLPEDPARRRALALGILALAAAVLGFGVAAPVLQHFADAAEHADRQRALLARLERVSAQGPALRRELETLDEELASPDLLLRAPSASQAAALVQEAVRRILEAEGTAVDSAQALPAAPQGPLLRVGVRVELRAGIEPLSRMLQAMDAHRPHLVIREALIAVPGDAGGAGRSGNERLAVRLDVQALARIAEGESNARGS